MEQSKKVISAGDVLGENQTAQTVFDADEVLTRLSPVGLYAPSTKIAALPNIIQERVGWYFGENTEELTAGQIATGLATIAREFDVEHNLIRITRDELWRRSTRK